MTVTVALVRACFFVTSSPYFWNRAVRRGILLPDARG